MCRNCEIITATLEGVCDAAKRNNHAAIQLAASIGVAVSAEEGSDAEVLAACRDKAFTAEERSEALSFLRGLMDTAEKAGHALLQTKAELGDEDERYAQFRERVAGNHAAELLGQLLAGVKSQKRPQTRPGFNPFRDGLPGDNLTS